MQENENLQDQYKQLVEQAEKGDQSQTAQSEPINLGRVDMKRFATQTAEEADVILG